MPKFITHFTGYDGVVNYGETFASYFNAPMSLRNNNISDCYLMVPPIGWDCE